VNPDLELLFSGDQIKMNGMGVTCGRCGGRGEECTGFVGETLGKETTRKTRLRWNDNITAELHLSGLIGTASRPDVQKIGYIENLKFGC
jgi:hypothetical protein